MDTTIDFDKFGHCCMCHKDMTFTQVIDGKEQLRFSPKYTEEEFLLNDGSKMRVALCMDCKKHLTEKHHRNIMKCIIKGWQKDVDTLPWTEEKKKAHMDKYSALEIVIKSSKEQK